jgi:flagellar assembly protein FliH
MSCKVLGQPDPSSIRPFQLRQAPSSSGGGLAAERGEERRHSTQQDRERERLEAEREARVHYERGFQAGQAEGKQTAERAQEPLLQSMAQAVASLATMKAQIRKQAELELLKLALAVARRVVHRELTLDPDATLALLQVGLDRINHTELHSVRVHPDFSARIQERLSQKGVPMVQVGVDAEMRPGDIVFETARGSLDATLESQFLEIERGFADRL